ncbi:MAG: hypothetical protein WBP26_05695 [Candidatus Saccharimonadales bacterium]
MEHISKRNILFAGIGLVLLVYIGIRIFEPKPNDAVSATSLYSPLVKADDSLVIDYGGSIDPNRDSVVTSYKIFAQASLPMTDTAKKSIEEFLPAYISSYIQPSFGSTYIHIVANTIEQTGPNSYSFDFYIDSPESYFHYKSDSISGTNPVTQIPWEGIK